VKSTVVKTQVMVRLQQYNKKVEESVIIIQSFVRKYWLATGQVYTDQRDVFFHSTALGLRLQRGKDGFVRVISVTERLNVNETAGSFIVREGAIAPGDMVLEADGIDLHSPITKNQWEVTVEQIRHAPRPMKFVVASGLRHTGLIDKCQSVVKLQRVWRAHCCSKRLHAKRVQATVIIQSYVRRSFARCRHNRELGNSAVLAACEDILAQLEMRQAATTIQLCARQWRACVRTKSQKRRYMQTLRNVTLLQCSVRGWLVRRIPSQANNVKIPLAENIGDRVLPLSMKLCQTAEKQEAIEKVDTSNTEYSIGSEVVNKILFEQDARNESPEKCKNDETNVTSQTLSSDEMEQTYEVTGSKGRLSQSPAECFATSWTQGEGAHESFDNEENEPVHSVAMIRKALEASPCAPMFPIFPHNEVNIAKRALALTDSPQAPVPKARAGEKWVRENELRGISIANRKKNFERYDAPKSTSAKIPMESTRTIVPREKERPAEKKKENLTSRETMRDLGIEFSSLSRRMKSLSKFSPEWRLSKLEMELISDELQYLYVESTTKGARV